MSVFTFAIVDRVSTSNAVEIVDFVGSKKTLQLFLYGCQSAIATLVFTTYLCCANTWKMAVLWSCKAEGQGAESCGSLARVLPTISFEGPVLSELISPFPFFFTFEMMNCSKSKHFIDESA
jgi:hypothetical protein